QATRPATTRSATTAAAVPTGAPLQARIAEQLRITRPDYVVFVPNPSDPATNQTGNEHFLVFDGAKNAKDALLAIWTQSTSEGQPDQHIAFARSDDEGRTWSSPRRIAGPAKPGDGHIASWAFPLVSKSGRIYVLYSQHVGKVDSFFHTTGTLDGIHSDDGGRTWSSPQTISTPRTSRDNPDATMPHNIICWQKPLRLAKDNRYLAGITRWTSKAVMKNPGKYWTSHDSVTEFMRFENVDEDPPVRDLRISWFASDREALTVPHPQYPAVSICQEPAIVKLPDGRLFCVMRTIAGSPFWSSSADGGERWSAPRRLHYRDNGPAVLHPLSPCPIYDAGGNTAASARYALFVHNNDGNFNGYRPHEAAFNRRPVYLLSGRFERGAEQPVWFDEPKPFMDHDGTPLGAPGTKGRVDLALYASWTVRDGRAILWYPDRKFFLLGRDIGPAWFAPRPGIK
ncbi:MAG: sialidase family protein, partial [Tepidisphaeraceae bacterium]